MTNTATTQPLDRIIEIAQTLRAQSETDAPSIYQEISDAIGVQTFAVKGGGTFSPGPRGKYAVSIHTFWGSPTESASSIEFVIYGEATYRDRTDSGAKVSLTFRRSHGKWSIVPTAWLTSTTYSNGRSLSMPDGFRRNVAAAVAEAFPALDLESTMIRTLAAVSAGNQRSKIADALRSLEAAIDRR